MTFARTPGESPLRQHAGNLAVLLIALVSAFTPTVAEDDLKLSCARLVEAEFDDSIGLSTVLDLLEPCSPGERLEFISERGWTSCFYKDRGRESAGAVRPKLLARLIRFAENESDPWVMSVFADRIRRAPADWVDPLFAKLLEHAAPGVRRIAVKYFDEEERGYEKLESMWLEERDPDLLVALIDALIDREAPGLADLMWHPDPLLARNAIEHMGYKDGAAKLQLMNRTLSGSVDLRAYAMETLAGSVDLDLLQNLLEDSTREKLSDHAARVWIESTDPAMRAATLELIHELEPARALRLAREEAWNGEGLSSRYAVYRLVRSERQEDQALVRKLALEAGTATRVNVIGYFAHGAIDADVKNILLASVAAEQEVQVRRAAFATMASGDWSLRQLRILTGLLELPPAPSGDESTWGPAESESRELRSTLEKLDEAGLQRLRSELDRAEFALPHLRRLAESDPDEAIRVAATERLEFLEQPDPMPFSCGAQGFRWTHETGGTEVRGRVTRLPCHQAPGHPIVPGLGADLSGEIALQVDERFHDGVDRWLSIRLPGDGDDVCWVRADALDSID